MQLIYLLFSINLKQNYNQILTVSKIYEYVET